MYALAMRVCLVSREMAPFWGAGIGTYVASMARAWVGAGHEVHVLGVNDAEAMTKGTRLFPGVRFHAVDPLSEVDERVLWRSDVARRSQQVRRALVRLHAAHRFDFIEFPEYFGEGAMAIRGARLLGELEGAVLGVRLHSPDRLCRALNADPVLGFNRLLTDQLELESFAEADVVISPTGSLLEWCDERVGRVKGSGEEGGRASAVVPYPFDSGEFVRSCGLSPGEGAMAPETLGVEPEILYFGRLERRKGVDLLIDAFGMLVARGVACRLRLVGGDTRTGPGGASMREHLVMRMESGARERVVFEEARARSELGAIVRASMRSGGVCCFPSRWENFPNAVLEAMALGAAVVCSDAGGMSEIVEPGRSGVLFPTGSAADLAEAIEGVLKDRTLRERLGKGAAARVASLCDPARVVEMTVSAVGSAVGSGRKRSGTNEEARGVPEIVIDRPGAAREIDAIRARAEREGSGGIAVLRAEGVRLDPRMVGAGVRAMRADAGLRMVTAHVTGEGQVTGEGRERSWVPFGLHADALCALDLSGIGAAAVVRVGAIGGAGVEGVCAAAGVSAEWTSWIVGALLCDRSVRSWVIPEPWIVDGRGGEGGGRGRAGDAYAIGGGASMQRARMVAADLLGGRTWDAARLLASVLAR